MISVIVVAAGRSTRMAHLASGENGALASAPDKLFLPLGGRPVLSHCLCRIQNCAEADEIIIVTRAERLQDVRDLVKQFGLTKVRQIIEGGAERQDSVWSGLQALDVATEIVAVHDGARPFFPTDLMPLLVATARQHGSAVVCAPVTDTVKAVDANLCVIRTVDRAQLRAVQTPQVFQAALLKEAYAHIFQVHLTGITDEAAAVEAHGKVVQLVECPTPNPKITTPLDLSFAELLLAQSHLI